MPSGSYAAVGPGLGTPDYMKRKTASAAQPAQPALPGLPGLGSPASSTGSTPGGALPYASGGAAASTPTTPGGSSALTLKADTNASLEALRNRYGTHLDNISGNTGHFMDLAGSRIRDAREGGRAALQQDSMFAGKASDPSLAQYDAATTGQVAGAVADVAAQRENQLTGALQGGVNVMGAPEDQALREKQLQVNAYQAQNAANNQNFSSWLALLNATRTSPIYTGV
jgi:hypothetical protein